MAIKESSDELNPTATVPAAAVPAARRPRAAKDYLALAIATCGVGYLPLAPGTWGSLVGIGLYVFLKEAFHQIYFWAFVNHWFTKDALSEPIEFRLTFLFMTTLLLAIGAITLLGTWAASRTEGLIGRKDPGIVVIDEVTGQLVAFVFLPYFIGFPMLLIGFVLFRFFDIVKPYPARKFEALPAGLGIMADDLAAGAYSALVLSVITAFSFLGGILPK